MEKTPGLYHIDAHLCATSFFAAAQESAGKDVERAFGILQSQDAMLTRPFRLWSQEDMAYIVKACVILRHMTIEDRRDPDGIILERSVQDSITSI